MVENGLYESRYDGFCHDFDGDAKDSSGNGNDGTIKGATFVEGIRGKALSFNGNGDYVEIPYTALENLVSGTITARIKLNSNNEETIIAKQHDHVGTYGVLSIGHYSSSDGPGNTGTPGKLYFHGHNKVTEASSSSVIGIGQWYHVAIVFTNTYAKFYIDGSPSNTLNGDYSIPSDTTKPTIGAWLGDGGGRYFNGIIDEVRIYNRALTAEEVKEQYEGKQTVSTALTLTKTASPYSIKQGQTTTITLTIKNRGTTDITNIEVMDSIHRNFDLIGGDFPNPRKYDIIGKGESREIQYMIKSKEAGTFNLDPATGIYADKDGNIQEAKSEPFSVKVITYFEPTSVKTSAPAMTPETITNPVKTASVSLYGEKTDVVLGEDILLKLSAVNLITKPMMHVQVIIIPPSGMSVTSSEFSKIAAGQFTANYELPPGDGRDIEVSIKSNQIGDFNVNGRIIYYFGDEKGTAEDHNLNLPIKVRKEAAPQQGQTQAPTPVPSTAGFEAIMSIIGIFLVSFLRKKW